MSVPELQDRLRDAVAGLSTTKDAETFVRTAQGVCELGRALNFAIGREFQPDPALLQVVCRELTAAACAIGEGLQRMALPPESQQLAERFAKNALDRVQDMEDYMGSRSDVQGPCLSTTVQAIFPF